MNLNPNAEETFGLVLYVGFDEPTSFRKYEDFGYIC